MTTLKRLSITQFRNLSCVDIGPSPRINLFYGVNGSGKTSVLEAVSLLGLGRSFRGHKTRSLVNHHNSHLTVFAELNNDNYEVPVGVHKTSNGQSAIKISGELVRSAAILAKQLPLLIINSHSFQLIEGAPIQRRQFLDWLVFHVKPDFSGLWKNLQNILKQRNSLLRRDKISYSDLQPWDVELVRLAEAIDIAREEVFSIFIEQLFSKKEYSRSAANESGNRLQIDISYSRGWEKNTPFADVLKESFERDARDGYTHYGPQRAELKIKVHNKMAADVLSRGQEKALVCSMIIAQAEIYREYTEKTPVFLVDDLLAELDEEHSKELTQSLYSLGGQVFVTGVYAEQLLSAWQFVLENQESTIALFHVEQGEVKKAEQ